MSMKKCPEPESNQRHEDFQSSALPTELSGHLVYDKKIITGFMIAYRLSECKENFEILRKINLFRAYWKIYFCKRGCIFFRKYLSDILWNCFKTY